MRISFLQPSAIRTLCFAVAVSATAFLSQDALTRDPLPHTDAGRHVPAHSRELFLAGGALKLCSALSPNACTRDARLDRAHDRTPPRYALTASMIETALDPRLWSGRDALREALRSVLEAARSASGEHSSEALSKLFERRCVGAANKIHDCTSDEQSPWRQLDDDQQSSVLAALELPQWEASYDGITQGLVRRKERASLAHSRLPYGAQILRAFVAAAHQRSGDAKPRIAVVTASAFDPFDPVDLYLDALSQAGAEVEWWPVDSALAAAVFEHHDCTTLPALRIDLLKLPARERIYPDLVTQQRRACMDADALAALPQRVQGVFFTGGDQWKLRNAFFDTQDRPNAWLIALRTAVANGHVVIGGTSAGSAVQSGGPMLSNGTVEHALLHGAVASPPPSAGCARANHCIGGLDEDAFTYWPAGGLGLAPEFIVDTHFSERARELRLLRLLADTGTRFGVGVDETSALHLRWHDDGVIEMRSLGASGGWVFDAASGCDDSAHKALATYLAPGATLRVDRQGMRFISQEAQIKQPQTTTAQTPALNNMSDSAFADGAMRAAAQSLAAEGSEQRSHILRAGDSEVSVVLWRTDSTRILHLKHAAHTSIGPMSITVSPWLSCIKPR